MRYIGRVIVNGALFLVIFAVLSINGVLIEEMQWKWAVEKWEYVSEGGLRQDKLRKKIDGAKFARGSYEKYINPRTNANLAASEYASACTYKDRFYLAVPDCFITMKKYSKKWANSPLFLTESALVGGSRYVLAANEETSRVLNVSKKFTADLEENPVTRFESMDFDETCDYLYRLLVKQEKKKITAEELMALAWGTKEGVLLDYIDKTAYFADDSGGSTVYVYEQTGAGERNLIFQYEDSYQGLGAGRFIMDHYFVGVEDLQVVTYDLETGDIQYRLEEMEYHVDGSINYIRTRKGNYYICYMNNNVLCCWDFYGDKPLQTVNMHIGDNGFTGLFCYGDQVYTAHGSGSDNFWTRYTLDKEEEE